MLGISDFAGIKKKYLEFISLHEVFVWSTQDRRWEKEFMSRLAWFRLAVWVFLPRCASGKSPYSALQDDSQDERDHFHPAGSWWCTVLAKTAPFRLVSNEFPGKSRPKQAALDGPSCQNKGSQANTIASCLATSASSNANNRRHLSRQHK